MKEFNVFDFFNNHKSLPLKKGCLVELCHLSSENSILSVVKRVNEKIIILHFSHIQALVNINIGDELTLKALINKFEYVVSCKVVSLDLNNSNLELLINNFKKYKNNRKARRFNTAYPATVTTTLTFNEVNAQVKNISSNGIFIIVHGQMPNIGSEGIISIRVDASCDDLLYCKVKIVRIGHLENYDCYYTRIVEIDNHNKKVLNEVLQKLKQEQAAIINAVIRD